MNLVADLKAAQPAGKAGSLPAGKGKGILGREPGGEVGADVPVGRRSPAIP